MEHPVGVFVVVTVATDLPGLHQAVVERQSLYDGGVCLGSLLELLQSQLPISILEHNQTEHLNLASKVFSFIF